MFFNGLVYYTLHSWSDDRAMRDRTCCGAPGVTSLPQPTLTMIGGQRFGVTTPTLGSLGLRSVAALPPFVRAVVALSAVAEKELGGQVWRRCDRSPVVRVPFRIGLLTRHRRVVREGGRAKMIPMPIRYG
jgi:hypothetical protein